MTRDDHWEGVPPKKTKPRCALGGVAAATELARVSKETPAAFSTRGEDASETDPSEANRDARLVLSCAPTRGRMASGFVAVALAPRRAEAAAAGAVFASVSVPSPAPRFRAVLGGAHVPAAVGAHVWLAGAHLLPHGGGGSWPGTASGFGWGNGGDVTCASARVRETTETSSRSRRASASLPFRSPARFVSSALVACEVADVFVENLAWEDDRFSGFAEAAVRLRAAVAEREGGSFASATKSATESESDTVVARAAARVAVSSASGHAFLPAEGGATVRVAWRGVGSLADAPRDPNWFACAFGAVAPVAMRAEAAAGGENAGACTSPARAPARADRNADSLGSGSSAASSAFGVAYPNFGRALVEPEADARGAAVEVVATASAHLWAPLASAVPRSGGAEVRVVGPLLGSAAAASHDASCAFGTARAAVTKTTATAGFVSFSCAPPRATRGGFVTLRVGPSGSSRDERGGSRRATRSAGLAGLAGLTGQGHVLFAYTVPRATSATPRSVPERGGSVVFVAGLDFPGDAAGDFGGGAARCAFFLAGTRDEALFAAEAAAVSSALTRCEMPPLFVGAGGERDATDATEGTTDGASLRTSDATFVTTGDARASVFVARGANIAPARASPSGAAIATHVAPSVAAARPSSVPADDGGTLVTAVTRQSARRRARPGASIALGADACAFGAVRVRANPADDASFECAAPTHARGAAPFALARGWDFAFDADVEVTFR